MTQNVLGWSAWFRTKRLSDFGTILSNFAWQRTALLVLQSLSYGTKIFGPEAIYFRSDSRRDRGARVIANRASYWNSISLGPILSNNAGIQWLREKRVPYIASISSSRFEGLTGVIDRFVQKSGGMAFAVRKKDNAKEREELLSCFWSPDHRIKKRFVLTNYLVRWNEKRAKGRAWIWRV